MKDLTVGEKEERNKVYSWFNRNGKSMYIPITIVLVVLGLIFIEQTLLFVIFLISFSYVMGKSFRKLMGYVYVLVVDFEISGIGFYRLSMKQYSKYILIDEDGRESSAKWKMYGMYGKVIVANAIDTENKFIEVNQICSNLHFVRDLKDRIVTLSKYVTKQLHAINRLKSDQEYRALKTSANIYDNNKVLKLLDPEKEVTVDEIKRNLSDVAKEEKKKEEEQEEKNDDIDVEEEELPQEIVKDEKKEVVKVE